MDGPGVVHTLEAQVATVVLTNPRKRNAMTLAMWDGLSDLLTRLGSDESVRVLVLRGAGEQAFVSGADIAEFDTRRNDAGSVAAYDRAVQRAQRALQQFPRPVLAAISGSCYGGGLGLALACDLRYCAPSSRFRMPAARLGLGYALEGVERMVAVLGVAGAAELFYTARVFTADDALRVGIVTSIHDDVFAHVTRTATDIASNAPLTIAAVKLAIRALHGDADATAVRAAVGACFTSDDYAEGRRAFAEKRPPRFTGR